MPSRWRFPTANDFGSEVIPASAREFYMKVWQIISEHGYRNLNACQFIFNIRPTMFIFLLLHHKAWGAREEDKLKSCITSLTQWAQTWRLQINFFGYIILKSVHFKFWLKWSKKKMKKMYTKTHQKVFFSHIITKYFYNEDCTCRLISSMIIGKT